MHLQRKKGAISDTAKVKVSLLMSSGFIQTELRRRTGWGRVVRSVNPWVDRPMSGLLYMVLPVQHNVQCSIFFSSIEIRTRLHHFEGQKVIRTGYIAQVTLPPAVRKQKMQAIQGHFGPLHSRSEGAK